MVCCRCTHHFSALGLQNMLSLDICSSATDEQCEFVWLHSTEINEKANLNIYKVELHIKPTLFPNAQHTHLMFFVIMGDSLPQLDVCIIAS